jgi:hypothetical protein
MLVSPQRDPVATRRIFTRALKHEHRLRTCILRAVDELLSSTSHVVEQHDRAAAKARTETAALGTSNQRRAAFVRVSAEATTNSGLHADRGIGSRRSSPNSLWPLIRHLRRRRLLSANATDPVGDRGLVALRLASWPRSYLGGGACEIWPVANATLSLRLIASCRISATARPFRGGQPLRAESRTFELDAALLAGPARLGVLTGEVETVVGGGA